MIKYSSGASYSWSFNLSMNRTRLHVMGIPLCFFGDPGLELTLKFGLVLDHPYQMSLLGTARCKRFSMLIVDGVIKSLHAADSEDDSTGDNHPEVSLVE